MLRNNPAQTLRELILNSIIHPSSHLFYFRPILTNLYSMFYKKMGQKETDVYQKKMTGPVWAAGRKSNVDSR